MRTNFKETQYDMNLKHRIIQLLKEEGHSAWVPLLNDYIILSNPGPNETACTIIGKPIIMINDVGFDEDYWTVLVRHELLHKYADHYHEAARAYAEFHEHVDPDDLDNLYLEDLAKIANGRGILDAEGNWTSLENIAGDLNMSAMYTERDKELISHLVINGINCGAGLLLDTFRGLNGKDLPGKWMSYYNVLKTPKVKTRYGKEIDSSRIQMRQIFEALWAQSVAMEELLNKNKGKGNGPKVSDKPQSQPKKKYILCRGTYVDDMTFVDKDGNTVQGDDRHIYMDVHSRKWYLFDTATKIFNPVQRQNARLGSGDDSIEIVDPDNPKPKRQRVIDGDFIDENTFYDLSGNNVVH